MEIYARRVVKLAYIDYMLKNGIGMWISANHWRRLKPGMRWFLDNGAYSAYVRGKDFDSKTFLKCLEKIEYCNSGPDFIVYLDI